MSKRLDAVLVVDLEASCWDQTPNSPSPQPKNEVHEIIEIGYCLLHADQTITDFSSIFVRPLKSTISKYCTDLTGITAEQLVNCPSFPEAVEQFKSSIPHGLRNHTWSSWGDYDHKAFEFNCALYGVAYFLGPTHLNAKNLFALRHHLKKELGLGKAVEHAGLVFEGHHHSGSADAHMVAKLLGPLVYPQPASIV